MKASAAAISREAFHSYSRYRLVGGVMAILVLLVGAIEVGRIWLAPKPIDFISFWGAAQLAIAGRPELSYDLQALHNVQSAVADFGAGHARMPFPYLPAFLLIVLPFGYLPFPLALTLWVLLATVIYLFAMNRLMPGCGLLPLAFPPVVVNLAIGQNGLLTAALFAGTMALLPRRPFIAGLVAGCFIIKPQLALFLPVAMVAARQWRAIAGAAASAVSILLLGLIAFGPQASLAWFQQLPLYGAIIRDGSVGWLQLASVYAAVRQAGLGALLAVGLHAAIAAIAAAAVWFSWRSTAPILARASVLAAATALASPYFFLYDQVLLVIPLLWLAQTERHPAVLAGLWLLPIVVIAQHFTSPGAINVAPLVPIGLLLLVLAEMRSMSEPLKGTQAASGKTSSVQGL